MNQSLQSVFLSLLRAGMYARPADASLFPVAEADWQQLYFMSHKQTMQALVADAVATLPPDLLPPAALWQSWQRDVAGVAQSFRRQLLTLTYLYTRLQVQAGITPVVLKGMGLAVCYPNPSHRVSGDIDLFYGTVDQCRQVNDLFRSWGIPVDQGANEESLAMFNDVIVENHGYLVHTHHLTRRKRQQSWLAERLQSPDALRTIRVEGTPITVLHPTLDLVQLLTHALKHLLNEGISFRQLADVAFYLRAHKEQIDAADLRQALRLFGIEDFAQLVFAFLVDNFDFPTADLPFFLPKTKNKSSKLLEEIWKSGNFGQLDERNAKRPDSKMGGKLFTARRIYRNTFHFGRYAPGESLGNLLDKNMDFFKAITNKKK